MQGTFRTLLCYQSKLSKMKTIFKIFTIQLIFILTACGGAQEKSTIPAVENSSEKTGNIIQKEELKLVEITVLAKGEAMNEIAFEPRSITIQANTRIRMTFKNQSSAEGMLHNFVLVELGAGQEIATAGIKAGKENGFVPKDSRIITNTKMTQMGEEITFEFDAPKKGSYHYICTYPGHYPNMIGRLNVE